MNVWIKNEGAQVHSLLSIFPQMNHNFILNFHSGELHLTIDGIDRWLSRCNQIQEIFNMLERLKDPECHAQLDAADGHGLYKIERARDSI